MRVFQVSFDAHAHRRDTLEESLRHVSMMLNESGKLRRAPYKQQKRDDRTLEDKIIAGAG